MSHALSSQTVKWGFLGLLLLVAVYLCLRTLAAGWADWNYRPALSAVEGKQFGSVANNEAFLLEVKRLETAMAFAPQESRYPAMLGRLYYKRVLNLPKQRLAQRLAQQQAADYFEQALRLNKRDITSLQHLILLRGNLGQLNELTAEQIQLLAILAPREFRTHLPVLRSFAPILAQVPIEMKKAYFNLLDVAYQSGGPGVLRNLRAVAARKGACGLKSRSGQTTVWLPSLCQRLEAA